MPTFKDWIAGRSAVTIADADELYVRDDDADTSKRITWSALKTALGAVTSSTVDAKGDILVATADNTVTRLAVGSNDQVLTVDSAQATGLKWAAGGGSGGGTTSIFVAASEFYTGGGRANSSSLAYIRFVDSTSVVAHGNIMLPTDWSTFDIDMITAPLTATSGDIWLQWRAGFVTIGDDLTGLFSDVASSGGSALTVGTQNIIAAHSIATGATNTSGESMNLYYRRDGGAGGDTYAGEVAFLGALLTKAS